MKHPIILIVRWIVGISLLIAAYVTGSAEASQDTVGFLAFLPLLYSMGMLLAGMICIAPELMHWCSIPIRIFFENLLYPTERGVAPPDYTLTRLYCEQGRYDEALEQYEMIVTNHPGEFLAYVEAINLSFDVGQVEVADRFYKRGISKLSTDELRAHLHSVYEEAKNRPREEVVEEEEEVLVEEQAAAPVEEEQPEPRVWRDHPNL